MLGDAPDRLLSMIARRKATVEVAGVVSQRLRYVELLLHHLWSIDFEPDGFAAKI